MSYILLLGPLLEEKYGSGRLMGIILASALAASLANILLLHTGVVGASGVVFTFILLSSVTGLREGELPITFILVAALYFGQQIYGALFIRGNVSYLGHIAGGVVGAIVGFLLPAQEKNGTSGYGIL
jgi:GlpG protein